MRRAALLLGLLVGVAGPVVASFSGALESGDDLWPLSWLGWALVGYLILMRRPGNGVGRTLLFIGSTMGLSFAALAVAAGQGPIQLRVWAELVNVIFGVVPWVGIVWLVLVYLSGRPEGRGERLAAMGVILLGVIAVGSFAFGAEPMYETGVPSPLAIEALRPATSFITMGPGFLLVIGLLLVAIVLMVRRWRRSAGIERMQFRWLFLAALGFMIILIISQFLPDDSSALYLWLPAGYAIPTAIGIAILRYRLFEIDRILSRTVTYALVVGLLGLVVLGLVTLFAQFLPSDDPLVVAVSTLTAAALFNPVRRRVQAVIDRRFNRGRYDAERVIEEFSGSLRDRVDPDEVVEGWVGVVSDTMEPASVGVWVRR